MLNQIILLASGLALSHLVRYLHWVILTGKIALTCSRWIVLILANSYGSVTVTLTLWALAMCYAARWPSLPMSSA